MKFVHLKDDLYRKSLDKDDIIKQKDFLYEGTSAADLGEDILDDLTSFDAKVI